MAKRLSNEKLMYKLVKEGASKQKINAQFKKRYPDATPEFFKKRVTIYTRIAERQLEAEAKAVNA